MPEGGIGETATTLLPQGGNYKFEPQSETDGARVDPRVHSDRIVSGTTSV